ncbi:MAG: hypothetical protein R3A12_09895 [Ignavibacteria bacterium]
MTKLNSAVIASGTDIDNFTVTNDSVEAYGSNNSNTFRIIRPNPVTQ